MIIKTVTKSPDADTLYAYTYTVKNNSDSDISISEMGLFTHNEWVSMTFMWAREVFDKITLKPGEVRAFTMTIAT